MTDLEILSRRVLKLEARLRWMTRAGIIVVLMVAAAAIMAEVPQTPQGLDQLDVLQQIHKQTPLAQQGAKIPEDEVRSNRFVLVDPRGKDRASLVADNAGSVFLIMFDAQGRTRANLSVGNEGPSLIFYDNAGKPRTIIGSTTLVGSHVNENGIAELSPPSSIVLFDKAGRLLFRQP